MKAVTQEELLRLPSLGNVKVKDGRVVFVKGVAKEDRTGYDFTLQSYQDGQLKPLTSFGKESNFAFAEDGKSLYFTGNRSGKEKTSYLYQLPLDGGEAVPIAEFDHEGFQIAEVLDDSRLLLTVKHDLYAEEKEADPDSKDYEVFDELPFYFNGRGIINKLRTELYLFDLKTGQETLLTTDKYFNLVDCFWLEGELYVTGTSYKNEDAHFDNGLYRVDLANASLVELFAPGQGDISDLFVLNHQIYGLVSMHEHYGLNEYPQFYKLTEHGFEKVLPYDGATGNRCAVDLATVGGNLGDTYQDKYYFVQTVVDHCEIKAFDGKKVEDAFAFSGTIQSFKVCKSGIYFVGAAADEIQELYLVHDGELTKLSHNMDLLKDYYVAQTQEVKYLDVNGKEQLGWVLLPKDYQKGQKYPAILDVHGGPLATYPRVFFHEMQLWASRGYFVFFCNIHGSAGQDNEYGDVRGKYGTIDYDDLMNFTDKVLATYPDIDQARLGITGGSYGGFMTNWVIGHTNRFKAAASQRSIANWLSFEHVSDISPYFVNDQVAGSSDNDLEKLWEQSPLKYVANVETPTLFINSDEDYRCPISEGTQMFHALLSHGVEARMCVFHGENHELSRSGQPKHRIRRLNEITDWFDKHLK